MVYLYLLLTVIAINAIPFFMPATWTVLASVAAISKLEIFYIVAIGVIGATIGRVILAKLSRVIVRKHFLTQKTIDNIDAIKIIIEKRKKYSITFFLLYAFSPLPTNQLFIAYGLTNMPIRLLVIPFMIGRIISYTLLTYTGAQIGEIFEGAHLVETFSWYFVASQIGVIFLLYLFTKINWKKIAHKV